MAKVKRNEWLTIASVMLINVEITVRLHVVIGKIRIACDLGRVCERGGRRKRAAEKSMAATVDWIGPVE